MISVKEKFPELVEALAEALEKADEVDLSCQVREAVARRVTFDNSANAAYLYLEPKRTLNVVEQNVMDQRIAKTMQVETSFWTVLDVDNFDRLVGIEVLDPGTLKKGLREQANACNE